MMVKFDQRINALEELIKNQTTGSLWVDMTDNTVRVDVGFRRGKEKIFKNTYQAARWLETQIDAAPAAVGSINIKNICDLYQDSEKLKAAVVDVFGPDDLPGTKFGHLKTDQTPADIPADINLWMLAAVILEKTAKLAGACKYAELPEKEYAAFYVIYCWDKEIIRPVKEFGRLVKAALAAGGIQIP